MLKFQTPRKLWRSLIKVFINTTTSEKEPHHKVNTHVKEDEPLTWTNACSDLESQADKWDKKQLPVYWMLLITGLEFTTKVTKLEQGIRRQVDLLKTCIKYL